MTELYTGITTAVNSKEFLVGMLLLIATTVITGLIVPYFVRKAQENSANQKSIHKEKTSLLTEFSEVAMKYETLALDVSWFGSTVAQNIERQQKAFEKYNEEVVDLVSKWRALISRTELLVGKEMADELKTMLRDTIFVRQDTPIIELYNHEHTTASDWDRQHRESEEVLLSVYEFIIKLGTELGIKR